MIRRPGKRLMTRNGRSARMHRNALSVDDPLPPDESCHTYQNESHHKYQNEARDTCQDESCHTYEHECCHTYQHAHTTHMLSEVTAPFCCLLMSLKESCH